MDVPKLEDLVVGHLASAPEGLGSAALCERLGISQPSLSRLLKGLKGRGLVQAEGRARNTRYHLVGGRRGLAALRSRRLHELVARKLVGHPELLERVKQRLQSLSQSNPTGNPYHCAWAELIDSSFPGLLRKMSEDSSEADLLRKESPFTVLITPGDRLKVFQMLGLIDEQKAA